jgi:hypothetical protein
LCFEIIPCFGKDVRLFSHQFQLSTLLSSK